MNETRASVENFELNRHAVVEASAGTGKTYTIEHLVLRLLTEENDVALDHILVVTFTDDDGRSSTVQATTSVTR